jgi:benzoyl-CoA reductase subunit D
MITVGIDSGSQNTRAVVMKDGKIIGKKIVLTEFDAVSAAETVFESALKESGVNREDVVSVAVTGRGRSIIKFADKVVNEVGSGAKGAWYVNSGTHLVIDLGAESSRVIKLNDDGSINKYEVNDKCASGSGIFIETMARALQIPVEEMGAYSLRHTKEITTNAQCVVFAESEVISLIHDKESIEDIAYGIHSGIVTRIASLIRRVGMTDNVTLIGGPGHNIGMVKCMEKVFEKDVFVAEDTNYVNAIGAAIFAKEQAEA